MTLSQPELAGKSSNRERASKLASELLTKSREQAEKGLKFDLAFTHIVARELEAAYDSHSLAIAELEAKLAGVRNETLKEALAVVVKYRTDRLQAAFDNDTIGDDVGAAVEKRMGDGAFDINCRLQSLITQPDRSLERERVIRAAIAAVDAWGPKDDSFHEDLLDETDLNLLQAVQVLTEPQPSADRIDPTAGAMRVTGGQK